MDKRKNEIYTERNLDNLEEYIGILNILKIKDDNIIEFVKESMINNLVSDKTKIINILQKYDYDIGELLSLGMREQKDFEVHSIIKDFQEGGLGR